MDNKKPRTITVFMDGTDWRYEVGEAADGNKIYPSVDCLKEYNKCWKGCGIVECEIQFKNWIVKDDWDAALKEGSIVLMDGYGGKKEELLLSHAEKLLEYFEERVEKQKNKIIDLKLNLKGKIIT